MLLSRHFSLWLRRTIPLAVRCPLCRPLHLVSCIQIFSFSCVSAALLTPSFFQLSFATSKSGLQLWTLLSQHHLCALRIRLFFFFPGALSLHETHYFSHSIWFHSL